MPRLFKQSRTPQLSSKPQRHPPHVPASYIRQIYPETTQAEPNPHAPGTGVEKPPSLAPALPVASGTPTVPSEQAGFCRGLTKSTGQASSPDLSSAQQAEERRFGACRSPIITTTLLLRPPDPCTDPIQQLLLTSSGLQPCSFQSRKHVLGSKAQFK